MKCSSCQTAIAAAHEVDDAFHGIDGLLIPQPLKRALERLCLALDYMHDNGKPSFKYVGIADLIAEGEEQGRDVLPELTVLQAGRVPGVLPGAVRGPLSPAKEARKVMRERARAFRAAEKTHDPILQSREAGNPPPGSYPQA